MSTQKLISKSNLTRFKCKEKELLKQCKNPRYVKSELELVL